MSTFVVPIKTLTVEDHPEADRLDVVTVDGYQCVAQKDRFVTGDKALYVPEAAIVPENLLRPGFWGPCSRCKGAGVVSAEMAAERKLKAQGLAEGDQCPFCEGAGEKGMLGGPNGDIVAPVRLRGILSQGILFDLGTIGELLGRPNLSDEVVEGDCLAEPLGVMKFVPEVPDALKGKFYVADGISGYTDIENYKRFNDVLVEGEEVIYCEKVHGMCLTAFFDGERFHTSSRSPSGDGFAIDPELDEAGKPQNFYRRCADDVNAGEALRKISERYAGQSVTLYGEALPSQDLRYGMSGEKPTMLAFDLKIAGEYVDYDTFLALMDEVGVPTAPVLYRGPFSRESLDEYTSGKTTIGGDHVREGVVVRPTVERHAMNLGRVILKSISPAYLLRKGGTEFS